MKKVNFEGTRKLPKFAVNILKSMWISCSNKVATALSEMINKEVKITSSSMKILLINEIPKLLNPEDITTTIVYTQLLGTIKGVIVISSPLENILKMADMLLHKKIGHYKDLSDENVPVIKELGNILAGYYISGLNKLFETKYEWTPPNLSVYPYRAIEDFSFGQVYKEEIYVLMFKAGFHIKEENIREDILLLFKRESIEKILELISRKVKLTI
jgi:chemotaxis protein CheC